VAYRLSGEGAPGLEHDAESEQRHPDRLETEPSGSGLADELCQFAMDCVDASVMLLVGLAARSLLVVDSAVELAQLLLVTLDRTAEVFDPLLESLLVPRAEADRRSSSDAASSGVEFCGSHDDGRVAPESEDAGGRPRGSGPRSPSERRSVRELRSSLGDAPCDRADPDELAGGAGDLEGRSEAHDRSIGRRTRPVKPLAPVACLSGSVIALPQHPDQHRPERPVLLAVDQQLGEGAALRIAPELSDPVGSLEVGEHQDVEELGAGSRTKGIQALP
jgi:hypothetical protein